MRGVGRAVASEAAAQYIAEGYSSGVLALSLKSLPIPEWQRNGRSRYEGRIQEQRPKKQRSS